MQPTAALIVFGGTLGAVMLQYPLRMVFGAFGNLRKVFFERNEDPMGAVAEMVGYAQKARKEGIVSLDAELEAIEEPFLKKSLMLAVDGTEPADLRTIMELELDNRAERDGLNAKVFESAGGFSPTIGIIGAVLGLIQVMQHLDNIGEVGRGIAVAFVATVYGVGLANIILLPAATKIKSRIELETEMKQLKLEGVVAIVEGLNPKLIRSKLDAYKHQEAAPAKAPGKEKPAKKPEKAPADAPQAAPAKS
jgi:chemotaxis protein MotA